MTSLLLGAGNCRLKRIHPVSAPDWNGELITIDMNPNCGATIVWDLENRPLPFEDDTFDEMGAFDVLEHLGKQGDWRGWFDEMAEYHRILKPGGIFGVIVPIGGDAFADPGHTRFFSANWFTMLSQQFYQDCIDNKKAVTDYRWYWKKNFDVLHLEVIGDHHLGAMLQKA